MGPHFNCQPNMVKKKEGIKKNKVELAGKEAGWCQQRRKTGKISKRTNPVSKERQKAQGKNIAPIKI